MMERGKLRTGTLRTAVGCENQNNVGVSFKNKRVARHLSALDQNADKKLLSKPHSHASSVSLNQKDHSRKFVIVPKPTPSTVINIDGEKETNYLNCPDLAPSQYNYLFKIEEIFVNKPNYLDSTSVNVVQRQRLIDWMALLHGKFCDTQETLFIAVNYFDRFLAAKPTISQEQLQTVAATALYTSSKFEEIYPIPIDELCGVTEGLGSVELTPVSIRKAEYEMLKLLRFRINPPLKNHFLRRCSMAAGATINLHVLSKFLIEASMYDPDLASSIKASLIAATSSFIALSIFGERTKVWDKTMAFYSGYTEAEIIPIIPRLAAVVRQLISGPIKFFVAKKWTSIVSNQEFTNWLQNA